jgi:hypothetical protein
MTAAAAVPVAVAVKARRTHRARVMPQLFSSSARAGATYTAKKIFQVLKLWRGQ